jgi:hypothetical protein
MRQGRLRELVYVQRRAFTHDQAEHVALLSAERLDRA